MRREYPSCASIARKLALQHKIEISHMTIRRDLWRLGAKAYRRPKSARLRVGDQKQRVSFCKNAKKSAVAELLFTDEKYFDCNDHGCPWQWVMKDEAVEPLGRDKWAPKVAVWGLIGLGVKRLVILPRRTMTAQVYRDQCLKIHLGLLKTKVLMHDGARPHVSKLIGFYLKNHGIQVLAGWPPRSPDLNPMENLWAIIARKVSDCGPTDEKELEVFIKKVWNAYPQKEVDKLVLSFPRRMDMCVRNKGGRVRLP